MIVIDSAELCANFNKYADISSSEQVMVQEYDGKLMSFIDFRKTYIREEADDELAQAIPAEEFWKSIHDFIDELYKMPR